MEKFQIHEEIIAELSKLLRQKIKHVTIMMPTGMGRNRLIGRIIKLLCLPTIVLVSQTTSKKILVQQKCDFLSESFVSIYTVDEVVSTTISSNIRDQSKKILYILYDTTPRDREALATEISNDATTISFGHFFDKTVQGINYPKFTYPEFEYVILYSKTILDIRDILIAPEDDRQSIVAQVEEKKKNKNKELHVLRILPINASPDASSEIINELRQKTLALEREIAKKEETLKIYDALLAAAGIPIEELKKYVEQIRALKNRDGAGNDTVAEAISRCSLSFFAHYTSPFNIERYSSLIAEKLTQEVWKKMSEESKTCLLTGKIAYQTMSNNDNNNLDYSGVCILATKALDIEISKRFYMQYTTYLRNTLPLEKWPRPLVGRDGKELSEDKFTLGRVKYIVGINENGDIINQDSYQVFLQYARAELYSQSFSGTRIQEHLLKCVQCVEKVRESYRNPAAHRTSLTKITAKECYDYLVDTYKKLKEILEIMRI